MPDLDRCPLCKSTKRAVLPGICGAPWHAATVLPPPSTDWVIRDIQIENRCGLCGRSFDIRAGHTCAQAAISRGGKTFLTTVEPPAPAPLPDRHAPRILRTLAEGPGNAVHVRGCACGAEVVNAEAYAVHIGWPVDAVRAVLDLYGIVDDLQDYPASMSRTEVAQELTRCLEVHRPSKQDTYKIKGREVIGPDFSIRLEHLISLLHMRHEDDPRGLPTASMMAGLEELVALLNGAYAQGCRGAMNP